MLYYLFVPLMGHYGILNVFRYLTFRSGGAVMTALVICFFVGPSFIRRLKVKVCAWTGSDSLGLRRLTRRQAEGNCDWAAPGLSRS